MAGAVALQVLGAGHPHAQVLQGTTDSSLNEEKDTQHCGCLDGVVVSSTVMLHDTCHDATASVVESSPLGSGNSEGLTGTGCPHVYSGFSVDAPVTMKLTGAWSLLVWFTSGGILYTSEICSSAGALRACLSPPSIFLKSRSLTIHVCHSLSYMEMRQNFVKSFSEKTKLSLLKRNFFLSHGLHGPV
jgi:hypothetical protein